MEQLTNRLWELMMILVEWQQTLTRQLTELVGRSPLSAERIRAILIIRIVPDSNGVAEIPLDLVVTSGSHLKLPLMY